MVPVHQTFRWFQLLLAVLVDPEALVALPLKSLALEDPVDLVALAVQSDPVVRYSPVGL